MSKSKGRERLPDHVHDRYYNAHLSGAARHANNPANNRTAVLQRMYYRVLTELATNRFKWEGLPDSVSVRNLELTLFNSGLAVFFRDEEYGKYLAMQGAPSGRINMQGDPVSFWVTAPGFVGKTLAASNTVGLLPEGEIVSSDAECVPIWANYMRVPDLDIVLIYAQKLAELDRTIEINSRNARRNKVAVVDENTQLGVTNIIRQIDEGQPLIAVSQPLGDTISALDLGIHPDSIEKLHILRGRLWNECMTLLGIKNANQDKKERLVADEVAANDEQIDATRAVNLNARREAAEQINARYGLDVSVSYHIDKKNVTPDIMGESYNMQEVEDADIHADIEKGD